jgi:hypothetical protein
VTREKLVRKFIKGEYGDTDPRYDGYEDTIDAFVTAVGTEQAQACYAAFDALPAGSTKAEKQAAILGATIPIDPVSPIPPAGTLLRVRNYDQEIPAFSTGVKKGKSLLVWFSFTTDMSLTSAISPENWTIA